MRYSNLYSISLGECGDSVWLRIQPDGAPIVEEINIECCSPDVALDALGAGRFVLADEVTPEQELVLRQQGILIAHPISEDGGYFVDADGRLAYR